MGKLSAASNALEGETFEYATAMKNIGSDTARRLIVGERGTGKTTMLLQAMTMAFLKGWVVINIPEALTIGHTDYAPTTSTPPTTYTQKTYTAKLLSQIARANESVLSQLQLSTPHTPTPTLPSIPSNISLARLGLLGAEDATIAHEIFTILLRELQAPDRPPLLLCIDNLAHVMRDSKYRDAEFKLIHAHQLELVKWLVSHLSGSQPLTNGGMVLAATSSSNAPSVRTLNMALESLEAGRTLEGRDALVRWDERVLGVFERPGLHVQRLGGLDKDEAKGLMEYWARSGVLLDRVDEKRVGEEWVVSGGGILGELERGCIRGRVGYQI
ncbi:uncharacterized protein KY384_008996 [Bacidia gigantensis]|uniref:uncharacterized protein n=1 Tax=Bacidia gigantensis TaxID=2732470 RepID=UPI001D0418EA|nr:uncharacterized protein KY384_008996 [Bacidia gigantensis]KAG8525352.1 hypothetical protein KY384_008996 [Bacidia gigantensis]